MIYTFRKMYFIDFHRLLFFSKKNFFTKYNDEKFEKA